MDTVARTDRWVLGSEGLVEALKGEHFNFESYGGRVFDVRAKGGGEQERPG
jgi:hypothetical protein